MMYHCFAMSTRYTSMREKFNDSLDDVAGGAIHAEKINPEKRHGDNHDPGGHEDFVPRRPGDLAHLDAHLVQKRAPSPGIFAEFLESRCDGVPAPAAVPAAPVPAFLHLDRFRHRHSQILPAPAGRPFRRRSGRGGGIRTPTLGFGDRWSTVEPTPLYPEREPAAPAKG